MCIRDRRTVLPSEAMSLGNDQLSHVRFRSPLSLAEKPTISRREEFTSRSARPSRAMSWRNAPGEFQMSRRFPETEVAQMQRPLDQISSPRGDQASPRIANG